jgi:hypothetical protein
VHQRRATALSDDLVVLVQGVMLELNDASVRA